MCPSLPSMETIRVSFHISPSSLNIVKEKSQFWNEPWLISVKSLKNMIGCCYPPITRIVFTTLPRRYDDLLWREVNLDGKHINCAGVLGSILHRGVRVVRLSKAEVKLTNRKFRIIKLPNWNVGFIKKQNWQCYFNFLCIKLFFPLDFSSHLCERL